MRFGRIPRVRPIWPRATGFTASTLTPCNDGPISAWDRIGTWPEWKVGGLFETGSPTDSRSEPRVVSGLAFHNQETAGHARVSVAAKLGTIDLIATLVGWPKPDRNAHAGNGVLTDTQCDNLEGMHDIFG